MTQCSLLHLIPHDRRVETLNSDDRDNNQRASGLKVGTLRQLLVVAAGFLVFQMDQALASSSLPITIATSEPMIRDSEGATLHEVYTDQNSWIWIEVYNALLHSLHIVAIIEVRDSNDISQSIQFREATVGDDSAIDLSVPWIPRAEGPVSYTHLTLPTILRV